MRIDKLTEPRAIVRSALLCGTAILGAFLVGDVTSTAQMGVAASPQEVAVRRPDGQTYFVPANNAGVLRVEQTPADVEAASPCTPETPCRYDDLDEASERAEKIIDGLRVFTLAESLGGVESLVCHPASMTHASVPAERRAAIGIGDGLVRFSVGVEDLADIVADVETAFDGV